MNRFVLPAAIVAAVASTSLALAAQTSGIVKSFDGKARTLTLSDDTQYYLPQNFKDPGLSAGKRVQITWTMQGNKHEASAVVIQ